MEARLVMHPIERLRYVARASGADPGLLARETAGALGAFRDDPAGMVTACRRVVGRHPSCAPLWWLCARALTANDPMRETWAAADDLDEDETPTELAYALPDGATVCVLGWPPRVGEALPRRGDLTVLVVDVLGEGSGLVRRLAASDVEAIDVPVSGLGAAAADSDIVVLEASAVGPDGAIAVAGSRAAAAVAHHAGVPVWLVAGVGRLVPGRVWRWMVERTCVDDAWDADEDVVPLDLVDCLVGPDGPEPVADGVRRTDCPIAPELFKEL